MMCEYGNRLDPRLSALIESERFRIRLQSILWDTICMEKFRKKIKKLIASQSATQAEIQISRIVGDLVKKSIHDNNDLIMGKATKYVYDVAKQFIRNNDKINNIINLHIIDIKNVTKDIYEKSAAELQQLYVKQLDQIVTDDKYQIVNDALVRSLEKRYLDAFSKLTREFEHKFEEETIKMSHITDACLIELETYNKSIKKLETTVELHDKIFKGTFIVGTIITLLTVIWYGFSHK
jgi:hypothetical protein